MKIAIIGAGFAGLSAAWDLAGNGHEVTVFDALDRAGGLAAGFKDADWDWQLEHFYHHLFLSDEDMLGLTEEIGFRTKIRVLQPVSASWWQGKAWPLDGPVEILRFPAMPFLDRVRMGAVGAWLKFAADWKHLEQVTAHEWLPRWMGPRAYAAVWEPLLLGKFGPMHYRNVPMSWLWARLRARTFRLGYPEGGFQALADALAEAVRGRGVSIRLSEPVRTLRHVPADTEPRTESSGASPTARPTWIVESAAGETEFDAVLATTGPGLLGRLAPQLPPEYLARLNSLDHLGAVVLVLALDRSLLTDGTYWLNMDKRDFPFLAVVEHTNLVDRRHYGGDHLLYVGDYLPPDHPFVTGDEEAVSAAWLPALERIRPDFDPSWIRRSWLFRAEYAQPVVPTGFSAHVPPLATPLPGLYLASMSQVYPWDRGTNFAVEIGRRAAATVLREMGTSSSRG